MVNATELFSRYAQISKKLITKLMEEEFNPNQTKNLRRWQAKEVAKVFGCHPSYLKKLIDAKKIPEGQVEKNKRRSFDINEIQAIRKALIEINPKKFDKFSFFRKHKMCQIIGVSNFKGGVGKSTTTVTLAHDLCLRGYRVLVLDMDGQGSSTTMFGLLPNSDVPKTKTIAPFLETPLPSDRYDGFKPTDLGYAVCSTNWGDNLDLIPANLATASGEITLSRYVGKRDYWSVVRKGLDTIKHNYDVILIDFPPSLGYMAMNGVFASDSLLVPSPPDMLDFSSSSAFFEQLSQVAELLEAESEKPLDLEFVKLMMTKVPSKIEDTDIESLVGAKKDKEEKQQTKNKQARKMKAFMLTSFGSGLLQNEQVYSEAFKQASSNFQSIFEMQKGRELECSPATLKRAIESAESVHDEIEELIQQTFRDRVAAIESNHAELATA